MRFLVWDYSSWITKEVPNVDRCNAFYNQQHQYYTKSERISLQQLALFCRNQRLNSNENDSNCIIVLPSLLSLAATVQ